MGGSSILRLIAGLILVLALAAVGVGVYQAGVTQGIVDAGRIPAGGAVAVPYAYGYGFHPFGFGFGLFGIFGTILFVLLLVGLFRFAFGIGRHRSWRGRGSWYGPGAWGPGWGGPGGSSGDPNAPWADERKRRFEEMHRRLHDELGETPNGPAGSGTASSGGRPGSGGPSPA